MRVLFEKKSKKKQYIQHLKSLRQKFMLFIYISVVILFVYKYIKNPVLISERTTYFNFRLGLLNNTIKIFFFRELPYFI